MSNQHRDRDDDALYRITQKQSSDIALAAATRAVQELQTRFMADLGINIADQKDIAALRADIAFVRSLRMASKSFGARFLMTLATAIAIAFAVAMWEAIKTLARQ